MEILSQAITLTACQANVCSVQPSSWSSCLELIAFNFMPNITDHDDIDEEYPFKPIDRNKVEQVFQAKLRERSKANSNDKNIKKSRK